MRKFLSNNNSFRLSLLGALLLSSSGVYASAFQVWEQTAYGTGDYHAGAAAEADDASLEFYNPAQITELKHAEISTGGVLIPLEIRFHGTVNGTSNVFGKSDTLNFIPNFHYVQPLSKRVYFAFGMTTPFGAQTDFEADPNNPISIAATRTQILTINFNPNIAVKVTHNFSLAVGADVMYGQATFNNIFVLNNLPFKNKLDGVGEGYNAGAFYEVVPGTKLGVSYRSEIRINGHGKSRNNNQASDVKATLPFPATTIFSIDQRVTNRVSVMASVFYTRWKQFKRLTLENTVLAQPDTTFNIYEDYRNTWNVAFGTHIKISKNLMWKGGFGYDETPTRNGYRDVRLPDSNKWALSTGLHWQATHKLGFDMGYTHLFPAHGKVDNSRMSNLSNNVIVLEQGTAKTNANVFGLQATLAL